MNPNTHEATHRERRRSLKVVEADPAVPGRRLLVFAPVKNGNEGLPFRSGSFLYLHRLLKRLFAFALNGALDLLRVFHDGIGGRRLRIGHQNQTTMCWCKLRYRPSNGASSARVRCLAQLRLRKLFNIHQLSHLFRKIRTTQATYLTLQLILAVLIYDFEGSQQSCFGAFAGIKILFVLQPDLFVALVHDSSRLLALFESSFLATFGLDGVIDGVKETFARESSHELIGCLNVDAYDARSANQDSISSGINDAHRGVSQTESDLGAHRSPESKIAGSNQARHTQ